MAIRRDDDLPTNFQWAFKRRRKCPLPPSLSWHSHMFGCCRLLLLLFTLKENNTGAPQRTAPIGKNNRNSSYFSLSPRGYIYFRHLLSLEIIQTWTKEQRKSSNFKLKRIYEKCKVCFFGSFIIFHTPDDHGSQNRRSHLHPCSSFSNGQQFRFSVSVVFFFNYLMNSYWKYLFEFYFSKL
jgi:hypothetical protein